MYCLVRRPHWTKALWTGCEYPPVSNRERWDNCLCFDTWNSSTWLEPYWENTDSWMLLSRGPCQGSLPRGGSDWASFGYDRNLACPSSALLSDVEKMSISWLPHSTVSKLGIASWCAWKICPSYASCSTLEPGLQRLTLQGQVEHPGGSECRCPSGVVPGNFFISRVYLILCFVKSMSLIPKSDNTYFPPTPSSGPPSFISQICFLGLP